MQLYQGPVLTGVQSLGYAGANAAIAEGNEGSRLNAASPAVREPFSSTWLDFDIGASVSFPGAYADTDFSNRGPGTIGARVNRFLSLNFGAQVQLGYTGLSATADIQRFTLAPLNAQQASVTLQVGRYHFLYAYGFLGDQVVVGGGLRGASVRVTADGGVIPANGALLSGFQFGPEAGVIVKPNNASWRAGVTIRAPVNVKNAVPAEGGFLLPDHVLLPWEIEIGASYQLGPRPHNPAWVNPREQEEPVREALREAREKRQADDAAVLSATAFDQRPAVAEEQFLREYVLRDMEDQRLATEIARLHAIRVARYQNWPRGKLLLVTSLLMTGFGSRSVAVEGFLDQQLEPFGYKMTASLHAGMESEPIIDRLRVRIGTYYEPPRFATSNPRQHFTGGFDLKLIVFNLLGLTPNSMWRVTLGGDVAPRYVNWSFGIGAWH